MKFEYFYSSQAEQFSFIRIPRLLIKDPAFSGISVYAKMLYSVFLDRMSLSSKNGWFDEENRVYIIYPVADVQEDLGIGKKKALEVIAELVEFGLLEKKRRGLGLPNLLYVKSFMAGEPDRKDASENRNIQKCQKDTSGRDQIDTPGSALNIPPEVSGSDSNKNKTDNIYTYLNRTLSDHIQSTDEGSGRKIDPIGYDSTSAGKAEAYREMICENIRYNDLIMSYRLDRDIIDGIVDLILETVLAEGESILIASNRYPAEMIKGKLLKLGYEHISYVMDCLKSNTTKVRNIKKYLLAALFNAPSTISGYYRSEVNHAMPQFALAGKYENTQDNLLVSAKGVAMGKPL